MPVLFTLESRITANTKSFEDGINRAQSSLKKLGNTVAAESRNISSGLGGGLPQLDSLSTILRGAGALAGLTAISRTVARVGTEFREATKAVNEFGDVGDSLGRSLVSSLPVIRGFFEGGVAIQDAFLGVEDAINAAITATNKFNLISSVNKAGRRKADLEFDAEQRRFARIIVDRRNERIKLAEETQAERMKVIDENEALRKSLQDADFALAQKIYEAGRTNFENLFDELVAAKDLLDRGILGKPEFDRFTSRIRERIGQGGTTVSTPVGVSASLTSPQSFVRLFTSGVREEIVISKEQLEEQKEFNRKLERLINATKDDTGVIN